MRRKLLWFVLIGIPLVLAAKTWVVKLAKTDVRSKPDFLSATIDVVKKGEKVDSTGETGNGWLLVKLQSGVKGYIHKSAVESSSSLSGIIPGEKGARSDEVALAAKGFNEEVEKKVKGSRGYNYADLEWVMKQQAEPGKVKQFIEEGKLK